MAGVVVIRGCRSPWRSAVARLRHNEPDYLVIGPTAPTTLPLLQDAGHASCICFAASAVGSTWLRAAPNQSVQATAGSLVFLCLSCFP